MKGPIHSRWELAKTQVVARDGMVVAGKRQAAEAGARMLLEGGNAVDAAVAAGWAVGVVEPWMSGVGGSGAMVVHHEGHDVAIDFGSRAAMAARPDMFALDMDGPSGAFGPGVKDRANEIGYLAAGVPGLVAGLCHAHARFGRLPLPVVMEPAIELAERGFEADWHTTLIAGINLEQLARFPATAEIFLRRNSFPPRPESRFAKADRIVQTNLATTLRRIAMQGAAGFYRGEVADAIARDMASNGGPVTREDLAAYTPHVHEGGLRCAYRDVEVVGLVGATGAHVLRAVLMELGASDVAALGSASPATLHLMAEACRHAYESYLSLSPAAAEHAHTTHLCAVDRDGNAASVTQTLGLMFGSAVTVPGLGVLLNNLMAVFDPRPGHPHSIAAGASQAAPYTPTVLLRSGSLYGALGAPGGRRIPTAVAQVVSNLLDHGMQIQEAISAPRLHAESSLLELDDRFPAGVLAGLTELGHEVLVQEKTMASFNFATPVGIVVMPDGTLAGGSDPVAPSAVVGV